jgi:hypothetical protein
MHAFRLQDGVVEADIALVVYFHQDVSEPFFQQPVRCRIGRRND